MTSPPHDPPPGVPPQVPRWPAGSSGGTGGTGTGGPPRRETRSVAFFVAIFLGILLVASAGLNVLLLLLSVGSIAGGGFGAGIDGPYDEVHVAGNRAAGLKVLRVPIHGAIAEVGSPLLGASGGSVSAVRRALRHAEDDEVRGVLLHIDSPGGGVTDSDEIHALVTRFRERHPQKPVMALFGDMAASGGYYVAVAAQHVMARRTSITGSIGVIMSSWNFGELARRHGVDQVTIKSVRTPYKDMLSPMRPLGDEERRMLTAIVDELLDRFVTVVDEGREQLDRDAVLRAATGAIFTASQAKELGLVDAIGDDEAAAQWFEAQLGGEVAIVEHRRRMGFADLLFGARTAPAAPTLEASLSRVLSAASGPRFLYYWEGGR